MEYLAKPSTRPEAEWSIWQSLVLGRTENRVGYSAELSTRPEAEWSLRQSIPVPVPSHNRLYLHFILSGKGLSGVQSQQHVVRCLLSASTVLFLTLKHYPLSPATPPHPQLGTH